MKKSKKLILFLMILGFIFIGVGVSYAYFIYRGTTSNKGEIIAGDIYMNFTDSDAFSLSVTKLESIDAARNRDNNMINFTISGDNSSNKNIIYSINLKHGEDVNGLNRVFDKAVRFDLVETTGGNEVYLADAAKFDDFDNIVIYVASIDGDTHNYERNFYVFIIRNSSCICRHKNTYIMRISYYFIKFPACFKCKSFYPRKVPA